MGLNVAGVDMLASDEGPMIMEVNSSPGLEGIERSSGVDIAGTVIDYVERNARRGRAKDRVGR
jgi:ribosomal protein S6--L-glutamate ligase